MRGSAGGFLKKMFRSITPTAPRALAGGYIEYLPYEGAGPITLATVAGPAWEYGNLTVIATTAQVGANEAWIEGILISEPDWPAATVVGTFIVELTLATGVTTAPPAPASVDAIVPARLALPSTGVGGPHQGLLSEYVPLRPPIYVPANAQISGAVADILTGGATKCNVRLVLSRNR